MDDDERRDETYNGFDNRMSVLQVNKNKLTKKTDGKCFGRGWGGWGWEEGVGGMVKAAATTKHLEFTG